MIKFVLPLIKYIIFIPILINLLIPSNVLDLIIDIPNLIRHMHEHSLIENKITVDEFIHDHYKSSNNHDHNDNEAHSNLPSTEDTQLTFLSQSNNFIIVDGIHLHFFPFKTLYFYLRNHPSHFFHFFISIWQPPEM